MASFHARGPVVVKTGGSNQPRNEGTFHRMGVTGRNLLASSAGEVVVRLIGFATLVLLARYLEPAGFGTYNTMVAYFVLAAAIGGFGLDRVALRDLASPAEENSLLFAALVRLRLGASLVTGSLLVLVGIIFKPAYTPMMLLLAGALVPGAVASTYSAALQARRDFSTPAAAAAVAGFAGLVFTLIGVLAGLGILFFVAVFAASEIVRAGYLVVAGQRTGLVWIQQFDRSLAWKAIRAAAPYGVLALLGTVYFRIDMIMLDGMVGGTAVGHYAGAFRILDVAAVIPALMMGVLFPRFAAMHRRDATDASQLYLAAAPLMFWSGLLLCVCGVVFAAPVLKFLYSASYAPATQPMIWLMIALALLFWHAPNVTVLLSGQKLAGVVKWSFVTVSFNIVANWFLIPRYHASGAAAATAFSEALSLLVFTPMVCRQLQVGAGQYMKRIASPHLLVSELDTLLDRHPRELSDG